MRATWMASTGFVLALAATGGVVGAQEQKREQKAPGPDSKGAVCGWKAADGLAYEYYVPKTYDAAKGANLLLVLHGSNLDRRWGFANHEAGVFRPDDVVVCPDGTTSNGKEGFNFMKDDKDLKRLHALQVELTKTFKVRATYLYGHSQGSFFAFLYAGAYPADVQGLVGQASGPWGGTQTSPKHFHQAVALMHGTADQAVPYFQSVGGLSFYREAKYPMAHLRTLEGWDHRPHQYHTSMELAWCEGMTSDDPARVAASLDVLDKPTNESGFDLDPSATWAVAKRVATLAGAPDELKARAAKAQQAVEDLAKRHVDAIAASLGKGKGDKVEDAAWVGHLPTFLRDFDGVPACDAVAKEWNDRIAKQRQNAGKSLDEYYRTRQKDPAKAFAAGTEVVRDGFLWHRAADADCLKALADWRADAAKLKIPASATKLYDDVVPAFTSGRKKGVDAFAALNKKE